MYVYIYVYIMYIYIYIYICTHKIVAKYFLVIIFFCYYFPVIIVLSIKIETSLIKTNFLYVTFNGLTGKQERISHSERLTTNDYI